jgi:peptidoglycan/LPS O-acetylase OafA/YrhL
MSLSPPDFGTLKLLSSFLEIYALNAGKIAVANILMPAIVPMAVWATAMTLLILSVIYSDAINRKFGRFGVQIRQVGLLTYPLYLLHGPIALIVIYLLAKAGMGQWVCWLSGVVAAMGVAWLVTKYAEPWGKTKTRIVIDKLHGFVV